MSVPVITLLVMSISDHLIPTNQIPENVIPKSVALFPAPSDRSPARA